MSLMKKLTALLLAFALLTVCLAGCAKKEAPAEEPTATEEPAEQPQETPTETQDPQEVPDLNNPQVASHHINAFGYPSYSIHPETAEDGTVTHIYRNENGERVVVDEAELQAALDQAVASCGDITMTNRELAFFYEQTYYSLLEAYSSYISYIMNAALALDEQTGLDGVNTWQQLILENALVYFNRTAALKQEAEKNGFELSDMEQAQLASALASIEADGAAAGASEEDMEIYSKFLRDNTLAGAYFESLAAEITYTDEDLSDYYDVNAASMEQQRIFKTDKNVVHVRHILITPADEASEDSWTEAETKANELLAQWQTGEATEDAFAALANEHSTDPGSNTNGGLYQNVYPGQMVEAFDEWCFADGRQAGDTGMVKTDYGYHVMFFSGEGDYVYWKQAVAAQYINAVANKMLNDLLAQYPMEAAYEKIVVLDPTAPSVPSAPTEESAAE